MHSPRSPIASLGHDRQRAPPHTSSPNGVHGEQQSALEARLLTPHPTSDVGRRCGGRSGWRPRVSGRCRRTSSAKLMK